MKKTIIVLSLLLFCTVQGMAQSDAISKYFSKYVDDPQFTVVHISGKMFELISELPDDDEDRDLKRQIDNLKGLRILSADSVNGVRLYKEIYTKLNVSGYEELMIVREGDQEFKFLIKEKNRVISELLMLSGQKDSFFMLSLIGTIDLKSISKLSKAVKIDGLEKLEGIDER